MVDDLEINLGDGSALDFEPFRDDQAGSSKGQGLLSSVLVSLLFHGAVIIALLTFSIGRYHPPVTPMETVQIQLVAVSSVSRDELIIDKETPAEIETSAADKPAQAQLLSDPVEELIDDSITAESQLESIVKPPLPVEPPVIAESEPTIEPVQETSVEPSLPSIVSIRNAIEDIETEYGRDTWVTDCVRSPPETETEGHDYMEITSQCAPAQPRDYSVTDRNSVYDSLNRVSEPVSRSRRTIPLLAAQRSAVSTRLNNDGISEEISDLVINELNNSVNTYYGNHQRAGKLLGERMRVDPAAALSAQIFTPEILHWLQFRKMANP